MLTLAVSRITLHSLGVLVRRVRERQMQVVIDYLVSCISSKEEEVRDIAALGESKLLGPVPMQLH